MSVASFDFILDKWLEREKNGLPEEYEELIKKWLDIKERNLFELRRPEIYTWFDQIVVVLEILKQINEEEYKKRMEFWKLYIQRKWEVRFGKNGVEVRWIG